MTAATEIYDDFVIRHLPPSDQWPEFQLDEFAYPERLNAAVDLLDKAVADGEGDRVAIRNDAGETSYVTLKDRSDRIARVLVEQEGLKPGNRVMLCGSNSAMLITAWFGILKAGGVVVALMPMLRKAEILAVAAKAQVSHAIVDSRCTEPASAIAACQIGSAIFFHGDEGTGPLEARMAKAAPDFLPVQTGRDDPAIIAFTSGTTGVPKGTVHFHRDLLIPADTFAAMVLRPPLGASWSATPPLAFTFGLGALILFPFRFRGTSVTLSDTSASGVLNSIDRHRTSILFTAPTSYKAMLATGLAAHDLSSLKICVSAGEHLPSETWQAWHDATGLRIVNGIGATELMHIFISASNDDIRVGSTGRAVPGYTACVLSNEGEVLREGEGRLAVKGPTGCRYLDDARQASYVVDGWNVTGDTYRLDRDGYFWYVARADDMIISSGYNIAPPDVETALSTHRAVAECAVIGVPDEARGQIVKAFVVLAADATPHELLKQELQDHVKASIAPYKYPRAIEFVKSLPRTATGKLQHHLLRGALPQTPKSY